VGMAINESRGDPRPGKLEAWRFNRKLAFEISRSTNRTHPTGLPPDRVSLNSRRQRNHTGTPDEPVPLPLRATRSCNGIHMWKS